MGKSKTPFILITSILFALIMSIGASGQNASALPDYSRFQRSTSFPIGIETLKIVVDEDGIYELNYADLNNAGMDVAQIDTGTLQMMHQGDSVAYQFIGDDDGVFEIGESVRFYGWAFDGSRHDKLFVGNQNVFWLWSGGTPTEIAAVSNAATGTVVSSWRSTVEFEEEKFFTSTDGTEWQLSDNEPEAWYWFGIANQVSKEVMLDVPDPVVGGDSAELLVEVNSTNQRDGHTLEVSWKDSLLQTFTWHGHLNRNLIHNSLAASELSDGQNKLELFSNNTTTPYDDLLINRISLTYDRLLRAENDQLQFEHSDVGTYRFTISGFPTDNPAQYHVWDISNRQTPVAVVINSSDIAATPGNNTVTVGLTTSEQSRIFASTELATPIALSTYTASTLEPAGGNADWLALAHNSLLPETNRLASHRSSYSGLSTHVVDVEDVYNQYGYGLARPSAVRAFLIHGLTDWGIAYGVLIGDATENPLKRSCSLENSLLYTTCPRKWSATEENLVLTDFQFIDRFKGMLATDHTFTTLIGDDEKEDIAIGRIAASNPGELKHSVDKIVVYDNAVYAKADWMNNMIWLADKTGLAGDFCGEVASLRSNHIPDTVSHHVTCRDEYENGSIGTSIARADFFNAIGNPGGGIVNYRGYGSNNEWGGNLVSTDDDVNWLNLHRPTVIIGGAALDGNFAKSGTVTLGEAFMALDNGRGAAAYWAASGLGYSRESLVLNEGFYDAIFQHNQKRIGDAIVHSKSNYMAVNGGDVSVVYSFNLQGDPAMHIRPGHIFTGDVEYVYLPIVVR